MDKKTVQTYNKEAEEIAKLHSNLVPVKIYKLIKQFFKKDKPTIDVGCGIGRDTFWLNENTQQPPAESWWVNVMD